MKNNKLKYVLLTAVGGIWLAVINMVFFGEEEVEETTIPVKALAKKEGPANKASQYELLANYSDPFLSNTATKRKRRPVAGATSQRKARPRKIVVKKTAPAKAPVAWPNVAYLGVVKNSGSQKQMHILRVNNKEELVTQGESLGGVALLQLKADSVLVQYRGEKKHIPKSRLFGNG